MIDYIIEKREHGWILKAAPGEDGVPMDAMQDMARIAPKDAVVDAGIAGALRVLMVVGIPDECAKWRAEIEERNAELPPALRWLRGCDVGLSSLSIFIALIGNSGEEYEARTYYGRMPAEFKGDTPHDADDFGRCYRLLKLTPAWEPMLPKVAEYWLKSKWPAVVPHWAELKALLEANKGEELTKRLRELNT